MSSRFSKGRVLAVLSLAILSGFAIAGSDWFTVSMSPNVESVILKTFDGYSSFQWLSPLLLVCLAALVTSSISSAKVRVVSLISGASASALLTFLAIRAVIAKDLSGLANEIESATGIAATHGVEQLDLSTEFAAWAAIGVFTLICLIFIGAVFWQRGWVAPVKNVGQKQPKSTPDAITLWDEQR